MAMPRSWCGVYPWSPTASDLQEFLQRNKTEADAHCSTSCSLSHVLIRRQARQQADEGELIASSTP